MVWWTDPGSVTVGGVHEPAYPAGMVPAPRKRASIVPLVVLSVVLVALVTAIVVVVASRTGDGGGNGANGPSNSPSTSVDPCVVGNWRVTSHTEDIEVNDENVRFTGNGARIRLDGDGTGVIEYGDGIDYTGGRYTLTLAGSVNFDFRTANGKVTFSNLGPSGTVTLKAGDIVLAQQPLEGSDDPATYTCDATTLVEQTTKFRVEMRKES